MNYESPVVDVTKQDEVPGMGDVAALLSENVAKVGLPEAKNYADDPDVQECVMNDVVPLLRRVREMRYDLEDEWTAIRRMTLLKHDDSQAYRGRSNVYMPVYSRNRDTLVASLMRGLFPSDEYLDVQDRSEGHIGEAHERSEAAKRAKGLIQYELEQVARIKLAIKPFLGQYVDFGNACLKRSWKKQPRTKFGKNSYKTEYSEGLQVSARNMHYVHVYPMTADNPDDLLMVAEDIDTNIDFLRRMEKERGWKNIDAVIAGEVMPDPQNNLRKQELAYDNKMTYGQVDGSATSKYIRTVTEIWTCIKLPKSAYVGDESTEMPLPARIVMCGPWVLYVDRNPFYDQKHPYLFGRMNLTPGWFYGTGFGRKVRALQYLTNDLANQTNDVGIYGLNPIVKRIPSLVAGPLRPLAPGVVWDLLDEKGISFDRPPTEQVGVGMQLMQMYLGAAQDFGGAPPILQGQKGAKTATTSQLLQRNAMGPLQDLIEELESEVMLPLVESTFSMCQQFMSDEVMVRVAGKLARVSPEDLSINPVFRWLASNQAMNAQQRAQQAMMLLQSVPGMMPLIQANGYMVNPVPLIEKVYSDGFGFRGFDQFIHKMEPEQMQAMQQGMPAQHGEEREEPEKLEREEPGEEQEAPETPRSALEQVEGGPVEMAPGEGEEFMNVRDEADDISAFLGSGGGM